MGPTPRPGRRGPFIQVMCPRTHIHVSIALRTHFLPGQLLFIFILKEEMPLPTEALALSDLPSLLPLNDSIDYKISTILYSVATCQL